ncbi:hypothetical protein Tdes44962_MAKER01342 [Teratosphaeria destructans]|uniref:Uncharacterized protein n=1 Tax=Teratosphaeria destructans TaxID=418781 RepID=A0A9W7T0E3_9PEZI|nr:hypothetical protein Tdes44962_MAKER01342 [Teratosphaeria destructans]
MTSSMTDALKGSGGGLQEISGAAGEVLGNAMQPKTGNQKKADQASTDLCEMANTGKTTTPGTSISAKDQVANMSGGSADHLNLGK